MSMMIGGAGSSRPSQIKMFLKAKTPEALVQKQLGLNLKVKGQASFTDINFVKGFWYCWFLVDIDRYPQVIEELHGSTEKSV